jgi:hypothetical protein
MSELVADRRLIETQANFRRPVTPEEHAEVMAAVAEEEAAARRRRRDDD